MDEPWPLPPGWEWQCLSQIVRLTNGRAFKKGEWSVRGVPIIRIQNLNDPTRPFNYFNGAYDRKHFIQQGDLLISWSGTPETSFGAFVWNGPVGLLNQHIFKVEFDKLQFVGEYLALGVQARIREMISKARGGVGLRHIAKADLLSLRVPIPLAGDRSASIALQQRVVRRMQMIMGVVEGIRNDVQTMVRCSDSLLAAAFDELLADVENECRRRPLGDVAHVVNGRASGIATSGVRVFKTKHVYPHVLRLDRPTFITEEAAERIPRDRFLSPGDVLMANIAEGTLGRVTFVAQAEPAWTVDGQVMIIRSLDERTVLGRWLYYYLWSSHGRDQILSRRTGIPFAAKRGQTHIYTSQVVQIQIPIPHLHLQNQIVNTLDAILAQSQLVGEDLAGALVGLDKLRYSVLRLILRGGI